VSKVIIDQTMSLDGFVVGPGDDKQHPLGTHGGERLFDWYHGGEPLHGEKRFAPVGKDRDVVETMFDAYGAFVSGRRTYDITNGWDGTHPTVKHVFILTHHTPKEVPQGESTFTFLSDVSDAIKRAKLAAGSKAVVLGTCQIAQQALAFGLADELYLHIAPLVLGAGRRLFERVEELPIVLEQTESVVGPGATHVRYRVKST
jgi:dihydrofolate reductase